MQEFTGTQYLKIDIANQFGLDRLNWDDRLHWVQNNHPELETLSTGAKVPLAYDKAVRALRVSEMGLSINHIMGLDATASGVQVMACMSGCVSAAKTVNLVNTGKRMDLYEATAAVMSNLIDIKMLRNDLKKPIMTFFYGSQAQPEQVFGDGPDLQAFHRTLKETLPGPYELMQLFQSFWDPTADRYEWAMPDGHVVHVPVTQKVDKGLEIDEASHLRFTYRAEVQAPQRQGRALAANIVHSVDGWIARLMSKMCQKQGFYMAPLHDNFYAHPNNMGQVRENYVKCLAKAADMNLVSMILSQIAGRDVVYSKLDNNLGRLIEDAEYALS